MTKQSFQFPELFQFFGGYFYQGWPADYRWETTVPDYRAVVRHFRAVNPPATVARVDAELRELLVRTGGEAELTTILTELGSSFNPSAERLTTAEWIESLIELLGESPTKAKVLRELR